jgi:UDP-N-acetyl-2-amino-2-deoxyglucuronate dehydrogenase
MVPLKLGLIGCGKIGQKHLQALVHQKDFFLVATMDTDMSRAEAAAVAFDAEAFNSASAMLARGALDAVIIATPSGSHKEMALQALEQGCHVLIEKPMTLCYQDAREILDQAAIKERLVAVTQFNRLLPAVSWMLQAVQEGRLGRLVNGGISVRWARPQSYYDEAPWRGTRAMDGGVLFNQAIHALDVLLQAMGPVEEVFADAGTLTHHIESEDTVAGTLRFVSGALASVAATTCVPMANLEERITVVGDGGVVVIGPTTNQIQVWRIDGEDEDEVRRDLSEMPARPGWQSHADALADFAQAIREKRTPVLSGESAVASVAVVEALVRSSLEHRPVTLREVMAP